MSYNFLNTTFTRYGYNSISSNDILKHKYTQCFTLGKLKLHF